MWVGDGTIRDYTGAPPWEALHDIVHSPSSTVRQRVLPASNTTHSEACEDEELDGLPRTNINVMLGSTTPRRYRNRNTVMMAVTITPRQPSSQLSAALVPCDGNLCLSVQPLTSVHSESVSTLTSCSSDTLSPLRPHHTAQLVTHTQAVASK